MIRRIGRPSVGRLRRRLPCLRGTAAAGRKRCRDAERKQVGGLGFLRKRLPERRWASRTMGWEDRGKPSSSWIRREERARGQAPPRAHSRGAPEHSPAAARVCREASLNPFRAMRKPPNPPPRELNWKATGGLVERESDNGRDLLQGWAREPGKKGDVQPALHRC